MEDSAYKGRRAYVSKDRECWAAAGLRPQHRVGVQTLGGAALGGLCGQAVWPGSHRQDPGDRKQGPFAAVSPSTWNFILLFS